MKSTLKRTAATLKHARKNYLNKLSYVYNRRKVEELADLANRALELLTDHDPKNALILGSELVVIMSRERLVKEEKDLPTKDLVNKALSHVLECDEKELEEKLNDFERFCKEKDNNNK